MDAAASSGPASKPIALFYALSQAGRAIAAARIAEDSWRIKGHGLSMTGDPAAFAHSAVTPNPGRADAYSVVGRAVGSEPLGCAVSSAEL
jgi:hypothetical protein